MSEDGLVREDGYQRNRVSVSVGLVVTDRNLVFAAVEGDGTDAGRLAYDEIASVEVEGETLVITTTDGVNWRFPLTSPESEAVDIAVRHLCWIGDVRNRLLSLQNDIELAVGKIRTQRDDLDWEGAVETYRQTRNRLDTLTCLVQRTTPLSDDVLAPELTTLDRRLEGACAGLFIERSRSQLELATHLVQYGDYEQACKVFEEAHGYYERADWHTEEVKRADAFQFGQQRDLIHRLEEIQWEMESAAAEPLQEANEARVQADIVDSLAAEVEHLETALQHYRGIRTLEWGDGQYVADTESVDREQQEVASRLIECHEQAARKRWNDGAKLEGSGELQSAVQECTAAIEHIERAEELAAEFDPEQTVKFESRLEQMLETVIEMRNEAADEPQDDASLVRGGSSTAEPEGSAEVSNASGEEPTLSDIPSVTDLAGLDVHHDITLDLEGDDPLGISQGDTDGEETSEGEGTTDTDRTKRQSNETESV